MNPPKFNTSQHAPTQAARTKRIKKLNNYMIPIQDSGYLHQSCKSNGRGTTLDDSHRKEFSLTFSTILIGSRTTFFNTQLFLSFQIVDRSLASAPNTIEVVKISFPRGLFLIAIS